MMGNSATVLFGREWPILVMWRFGKETGGEKCNGNKEQWRWRGADQCKRSREGERRKGRDGRMVLYSKDDAMTNPALSQWHSRGRTLRCGPNVLTSERPVYLEGNVAQDPAIHCELRNMLSNQPPEPETHGPLTTTSHRQRKLATNQNQLHIPPANLWKWLLLRCEIHRPHGKERTSTSLQENNQCPGLCVCIYRRHHLPKLSSSTGGNRLRYTLQCRQLERCCEGSDDEATHVYGIPSRIW